MEGSGTFCSRNGSSNVVVDNNESSPEVKSFDETTKREDVARKCCFCNQEYFGLSSGLNCEDGFETISNIFSTPGDDDDGSINSRSSCDQCQTLLKNLVRARDVFLQCFSDLLVATGRWLPDKEKSQVMVKLLEYARKDYSSATQLDNVLHSQNSEFILSDVNQDDQEQIKTPELNTSIELNVTIGDVDTVITITAPEKIVSPDESFVCSNQSSKKKTNDSREASPNEAERSESNDNLENAFSSDAEEVPVFLPDLYGKGVEDNPETLDFLDSDNKDGLKKKRPRKSHVCSICSRNCKTARELDLHIGVHLQERKFICEVCGLAYRHKKALEVHVGLHRGEAKFECEHCHKVFTQKSGLQRHLPIHTGEMAYQCDVCGKRFLYNTSFNVHKFTHTKHKEFQCFECGLSFFSKSHLKRHMKTHTGVKPHVCESCGKCFSERYNLDAHMRIHTGQKSHKCPHCELGFTRKGTLEAHILQKHSQFSLNS